MSSPVPSPLDRIREPSRLTARIVDPAPPRRILGYEVETDLAAHYGFTDVAVLLLRGELAEPALVRALEIAMAFLAPASVAESPSHVGVLSRVGGARWPVSLGLGALALAEEAAAVLEEHLDWTAWVHAQNGAGAPPPASALARDEEDRRSVARLRALLDAIPFHVAALEVGPTRTAALLAILSACGLSPEAMQTAWLLARLPAVAAEAAARPLLKIRDYPFNLPALEYREGE